MQVPWSYPRSRRETANIAAVGHLGVKISGTASIESIYKGCISHLESKSSFQLLPSRHSESSACIFGGNLSEIQCSISLIYDISGYHDPRSRLFLNGPTLTLIITAKDFSLASRRPEFMPVISGASSKQIMQFDYYALDHLLVDFFVFCH